MSYEFGKTPHEGVPSKTSEVLAAESALEIRSDFNNHLDGVYKKHEENWFSSKPYGFRFFGKGIWSRR